MNTRLDKSALATSARKTNRGRVATFVAAMALSLLAAAPAAAQLEFEGEPIRYHDAESNDAVARLAKRLESGEARLDYDERHGYLKSVLEALHAPPSSQVLVFSKTSLQLTKISPRRPRALYFNDQTYVGWVQRGDVIELMSTDPELGPVFYTLAQQPAERPRLLRDRGQCLACHASSRTQGVPGVLVRSVFTAPSGQPELGSGTFTIDHRSPFEQRWGGYYVTGQHGAMRHMGNVLSRDTTRPEDIDREAGANVVDLSDRLDAEPYLTGHSDLVALMTLEHQTQMQNLITRAGYEAISAAHYDDAMNRAFDREQDYVSESTERRIAAAAEKLVQYMLFSGEFRLSSPVEGTSQYAAEFAELGPRDRKGRSLRDFDLQTRMFKHPCSYLVYSPAFDGLPPRVKQVVVARLDDVLSGRDQSEPFAHLSAADRTAILEILRDTKPDLWIDREGVATASD